MKRKKILWISRHPPLKKQLDELRRIYGDFELIQYAGYVKDSEEVVNLMKTYGADDIVVILPMTMIYYLVNELGVKPVWPEIERVNDDEDYDYQDPKTGRKYRFKRFVRIHGFEIIKEEL